MQVHQLFDGFVVAVDRSFETHLTAEDVVQQPVIGVGRYAIDLVIDGMTFKACAEWIAAAKGGKKSSRSVRSETAAGPVLVPLSG